MRRHYRLTPTEARLAAALAEGRTLADASAASAVSVNTMRSHLLPRAGLWIAFAVLRD